MAPSTCKALVTRVSGGRASLHLEEVTIPTAVLHQVLVRVESVAQNPTDVQSLDSNAFGEKAILGCDYDGIVETLGDLVTPTKVGDRIAGLIWGGMRCTPLEIS
ncbi:hypothetical protein BDZ45DRAFT_678655 [Acephala macrosclerotiorum]|nr:hypothetical protein BDZ45DRAFT_678655 [Acephala macrosclerotiorum]